MAVNPRYQMMLYHKVFASDRTTPWVVFLHGAGGSSTIWSAQLRAFSREYPVLLIDLRGHGRSLGVKGVEPRESYDFGLVTEDVIRVLDHLGIERAHFVGVSLGTILIRELQGRAPERFLTAIHSGAIVHVDWFSRFLIASGHALKGLVPFFWLYSLFAWIIMPGRHHRATRAYFRREASRIPQAEFLRWFELSKTVDEVLERYYAGEDGVPTLFVMGALDHLFLADVRALCAERPGVQLEVIPECGHVCNVEAPQAFNRIVLTFLEAAAVGRSGDEPA